MLRQCEHADIVSEVSGSLFLHHLGLIKRFITCEKKKKDGKNWNIMSSYEAGNVFNCFGVQSLIPLRRGRVIQINGLMIYPTQSESTRFFIERKF